MSIPYRDRHDAGRQLASRLLTYAGDPRALVLGLPNNLSPFVEAGLMAGAPAGAVREALARILYDEEFRAALERSRRECLAAFGIRSDGRAAARAAASVMRLARRDPTR